MVDKILRQKTKKLIILNKITLIIIIIIILIIILIIIIIFKDQIAWNKYLFKINWIEKNNLV